LELGSTNRIVLFLRILWHWPWHRPTSIQHVMSVVPFSAGTGPCSPEQ
jgi:hypothetical protein